VIDRISKWILAEGDALPMAVVRVHCGLLIFWQMAWLLPNAPRWLGSPGWINTDCVDTTKVLPAFLLYGINSNIICLGMIWLTMGLALFLACGFWPRVTAFFVWFFLTSVQVRIVPVLDGTDVCSQFMVFFLIFSQTHGVLVPWRRKSADNLQIPLWPQRLMFLTLSSFYFGACVTKISDLCWRDGSAVYYGLALDNFKYWPMPDYMRSPLPAKLMTYFTIVVETLLASLPILWKFKRPILLAGIFLHLGIAYALFIPGFAPAILGFYWSALTGSEIRNTLKLRSINETLHPD
jgi:hypothetical protein